MPNAAFWMYVGKILKYSEQEGGLKAEIGF